MNEPLDDVESPTAASDSSAGRVLSPEQIRLAGLPEPELFAEFAHRETLFRYCSSTRWGENEQARKMIATWNHCGMELYLAEFTRRAAAGLGATLVEADRLVPPERSEPTEG